jgi:hypothetical protein
LSERSESYVQLIVVGDYDAAFAIRRMLAANGMRNANVWPVRNPDRQVDLSLSGPHLVTVPKGSLREARRLLRHHGLEM